MSASSTDPYFYCNGSRDVALWGTCLSQDRGLQYGHGLFETILLRCGEPVELELHLKRLQAGLSALCIPDCSAELRCELKDFLSTLPSKDLQLSEAVLKIVITSGRGYGGYRFSADIVPNRLLYWSARSDIQRSCRERGAKVIQCTHQLRSRDPLVGIKHLNRLDQVLASAELVKANADEGIMLNEKGFVIEATAANIFWVESGKIFTPCLSDSGVWGVMRHRVRQANDVHVVDAVLPERLLAADEIFLSNSIRGIWPVIEYTGQKFQVGRVSQALLQQFLSGAL